jgi:hypothetical protein
MAVELANAGPADSWRPNDLRRLRAVLSEFLIWSVVADQSTTSPFRVPPRRTPPDALAELQSRTVVMLESFLRRGHVTVRLRMRDVPLALEIAAGKKRSGPTSVPRVRGPFRAAWQLGLAFLLASEAGQRLRRCHAGDCRRYFLRQGRQEYCSHRCRARIAQRAFRQRWSA